MQSNWRERLAWFEPGVVTEVWGKQEASTGEDVNGDDSNLYGEIVLLEHGQTPDQEQGDQGKLRCKLNNYALCFTHLQHFSFLTCQKEGQVDAVVLEKISHDRWVMHVLVFQRVVTREYWLKVKNKFKSGMMAGLACIGVLGIDNSSIQAIKCYTIFRDDRLSSDSNPNLVLAKVGVGTKTVGESFIDWEKGQITLLGSKIKHQLVTLDKDTGYGKIVL